MKATWGLVVLLGVFVFSNLSNALEVVMAEAPTSTLDLTASALEQARKEILLNVYELTSPEIAEVLVDRIRNKVKVRILQEGQPVGGISAAGRKIQEQIIKAMKIAGNGSRLMEMTGRATPGAKRRFRYDHAKYAVIDGRWLLIGSENYSPTGMAATGTQGNRGWQVRIEDPEAVRAYVETFEADADPSQPDLVDRTRKGGGAAFSEEEGLEAGKGPCAARLEALPTADASDVDVILSPINSFSRIIEAIDLARDSIAVEQMTLSPSWETPQDESPIIHALVAAGRRRVKVRVLLNDETAFGGDPGRDTKNADAVGALLGYAKAEQLPIEARIADVRKMGVNYIHNKGLLADGRYTLVSSINWNHNSIFNNREAAVLIDSTSVHAHYAALFARDWSASESKLQRSGVDVFPFDLRKAIFPR